MSDMTLDLIRAGAILVWWLIGTLAVVRSMRRCCDVKIPMFAFAMLVGLLLGPFIAIWIWVVDRDFVVVRRRY